VGGFGLSTTNNGLISAQTAGINLTFLGNVTNNGTIEARNGGTARLSANPPASFTSLNNHTLTGGTWAAYAGSTINLGGVTSTVTTNAANVILSGAGSTFIAMDALENNAGSFTISGGRNFTTAGVFANSGVVAVGAGSTFTASSVATWSGGSIGGAGNVLFNQSLDVTADVAKPGAGMLRVGWGLTLVTGKRLDLTEGKMILAQANAGTADATGKYNGVQGLVQSAHHFGAWDGPGITTSMPDAPTGLTTIAIATANQTGFAGGTFGGVSVASSDVLAMYTYAGDANLDGTIDGGDYGIIDNFAQVPGADGYANGDFNYDGVIDGGDYGIIDNNIQAQGAPFPTSASGLAAVTAVPEPSTAFIVLIGSGWLVRLRRCRRL
jgi:fibronectin-binding autotransporter adhesin